MSYDETEEWFKFQNCMDFEFIAIKWTEFSDKHINCFAAIQSTVAFLSKGYYTCSGNFLLRFSAVVNSYKNKHSVEIIEWKKNEATK